MEISQNGLNRVGDQHTLLLFKSLGDFWEKKKNFFKVLILLFSRDALKLQSVPFGALVVNKQNCVSCRRTL